MRNIEETDKKQKTIQNAALAVALLSNFCNSFAATSLNIAVPHIGREYHTSTTALTWIILSYVLVTSLLSVPFGRIADLYGREKILKLGILLLSIAAFLNVFSPNMPVFIMVRILQGVGSAMIFATNIALVVGAFPAARRGSVLGITSTSVYIGMACGPVLGGFITHVFGWRGIFAFITAFAVIALVVALISLPNSSGSGDVSEVRKARVGVTSIFLYIASLGLLLYGLATLLQNIWAWFILAAGVPLIILFVRHEKRSANALIEVRLFSGNRNFSLSNLAALFNYASVFAITYLLSLYLQLARGLTADVSGLLMISQPIVQSFVSPIAGRLSDKRSPPVIASIGMGCCAGALVMFAFLDGDTPYPYIIAGLCMSGLGVAMFSSPNSNVIMSAVQKDDYGIASSILSTSRNVGHVVGMAILTIIINLVIGNMPIADVPSSLIISDMQISFIVFATVCVVGVFFSLQRTKIPTIPPSDQFVNR